MPKLLHSSEKVDCGAEVQLDSGGFCLVSVAQYGIMCAPIGAITCQDSFSKTFRVHSVQGE